MLPAPTAVILPLESTVTTLSSLLDHLIFLSVALVGFIVAVSVLDSPTFIFNSSFDKDTLSTSTAVRFSGFVGILCSDGCSGVDGVSGSVGLVGVVGFVVVDCFFQTATKVISLVTSLLKSEVFPSNCHSTKVYPLFTGVFGFSIISLFFTFIGDIEFPPFVSN